MFDIIVLVCTLGMAPQECQPPTALRQIYLGHVSNELMCGIGGQQHLASVASMVPDGYWPQADLPKARGGEALMSKAGEPDAPCSVPFCRGRVPDSDPDDEGLRAKHWRLADGPFRRRYESAWEDATKAEKADCLDCETARRVTSAWKDLKAYAIRTWAP